MENTVSVVTVTYNRASTLERTIESILNQEYESIDKILIVDNNSDKENKVKIKNISKLSDKILVLEMKENKGGAGGFYEGMKYVVENFQSNWIWIMDDDAYPRKDCLSTLIKESNRECGCVVPAIYGIDRKKFQLYHHKSVNPSNYNESPIVNNYDKLDKVTKIDANAFVGPLIKRTTIEKIGLPDLGLFIYGDDLEYTYRLSRMFNIYLIKDAIIDHQDVLNTEGTFKPTVLWKEYYMYRNKFLFIKKYEKNIFKKNWLYIHMMGKILKYIILTLIKDIYKGYRKVRVNILLKAIFDGLSGNHGKIIDPQEFLYKVNTNNGKSR